MKTALAASCALAIAIGVWSLSPTVAQEGQSYVMIVPGGYTTPEISAKCQAYAAQRVVGGSNTDSSRQAVALACVKKLWKEQKKGKKAA